MGLLIHIEDDPSKARAIERTLRLLRPDLAYEHYATANVGRQRLRDAEGVLGVITDWNMPMLADGPIRRYAGRYVVDDCTRLGLPVVVISCDNPKADVEAPWIVFSGDVRGGLWSFLNDLGSPPAAGTTR